MIYVVAIVVAIYPKSLWREADVKEGQRPYTAYLASSLVAAVLAFFIALTFKYVLFHDFDFVAALRNSLARWPWLVMSGGTAFVVAWTADDYVTDAKHAPRFIRVYEAVAVAIALVLLQWFVQALLESVAPAAELIQEIQRAPRRLVTAACVGLIIGYSVPHMCRQRHAIGKDPVRDEAALQSV